jgi:hypothetical protein
MASSLRLSNAIPDKKLMEAGSIADTICGPHERDNYNDEFDKVWQYPSKHGNQY